MWPKIKNCDHAVTFSLDLYLKYFIPPIAFPSIDGDDAV